MRALIFLTILLFVSLLEAVQIGDEDFKDENSLELSDVETYEGNYQLRDFNKVKEKIKNSILHAWANFKTAIENADKKLKAWAEKVKEKIHKLENVFEERLEKLRQEFTKIISKLAVTGEHVKECLQEDKKKIDNMFKDIFTNVKMCISNNVDGLSKTQISMLLLNFDESTFLINTQNKLSVTCDENDQTCLNSVQDEIIAEIEDAEENVVRKHVEARTAIDDHLESTVTCVTEGLIKAAKTVVDEISQILQCVKNKN